MKIKIAAIADIHYAQDKNISLPERRGEIAHILLLRAVHRLNRMIHPDITVVLGDILDSGLSPDGQKPAQRIIETLGLLKSPWIIIPGNHDAPPELFFSVFPRPPETTDVNNVRFVAFLDPEEPGFNARRAERDLSRMKAARAGWHGGIVMLQHTPLFPPGRAACPYNYVNAPEIIAEMRRNGIVLALGGHYHEGFELIDDDGLSFLAAPALCETPFSFLEIDLVNDKVSVTRHDLRLNDKLHLWDTHVHTQFAYCGENMDVVRSMQLAQDFGLTGLTFAEHSGQLYFDNDTYWSYSFLANGVAAIKKQDERMEEYFKVLDQAGCRPVNTGLELDCCFDGTPFVRAADRNHVKYLWGSIHCLSTMKKPKPDLNSMYDEFLAMTAGLVQSGINALAHPFRVFYRAGYKVPESLYDPVVGLLSKAGVAAEVNFHTQTTDPEFIRRCLAAGVKLSFGSDAHNLYEVGEFAPHLALLRECGFNGDLNEILLNPGLMSD